jgi:hypothetical protein
MSNIQPLTEMNSCSSQHHALKQLPVSVLGRIKRFRSYSPAEAETLTVYPLRIATLSVIGLFPLVRRFDNHKLIIIPMIVNRVYKKKIK